MAFADIGFGNIVNADRIVSVVSAEAAPTKRIVSAAREKNLAVDATCGKKTKSVLIMDSGHIVLSAKSAERILQKIENPEIKYGDDEE
ncbi:MAG: DUF370 domain-containing protein [Firmicutes bacterium]|nr:DUF370 domain-containing protein [[Eubacterium] siraeum]MCM1488829.1 DUF370 domain-containing protein [Bacillota bacterium]